MSMPNRAGLITPIDSTQEGEDITMLVMPVMLNNKKISHLFRGGN